MMMSPAQTLWQTVVLKAITDAMREAPTESQDIAAKRQAHQWFKGNGRDFRLVCHYAGLDPDFIRERYLSGQISGANLRKLYVGPRPK